MCYSVSIERDLSVVERALDAVLDKRAHLDFVGLQAIEKQLTPEEVKASLGLARVPKASQFRYALREPEGRVYPGYFAPVIIMEEGKRKLVPMRYRVRPNGTPHEIPTKYNLFNCRIDSLQTRPTWRRLLGRNHALLPFVRFHEWVEDPNGKKVQVSFAPDNRQLMWAPALFDEWSSLDGRIKFRSVAIVTGGDCMPEKKVYQMEQPHPKDLFDPVTEKPLMDHAYKMGYDAFMLYRHFNENPFNQNDWQRSDAWDEGWAAAENANPGKFDHAEDRFNCALPYIPGNPSCPF